MNLDALVRSIALRDRHHMLFLGAGASISSGIPTATDCIWRWKQQLFLSGDDRLDSRLFGDPSLPHIRKRIQQWLDGLGTNPPEGDPAEYSHYVEQCFPLSADRQQYFGGLVRRGSPYLGYRLLGEILESGKLQWIWTTNFDDLVDRGRPPDRRRPLLQVGMDSQSRLNSIRREGDDAVQVFLHGDYRYDRLRNTAAELESLDSSSDVVDADCRKWLIQMCRELPLVVLGYSGRDRSVMDALWEAYGQRGRGGLFWTHLQKSAPSEQVKALLARASGAGYEAEFVPCEGFDDCMSRLARFWLRDGPRQQNVEELLTTRPVAGAFSLDQFSADFDWSLGNAYPIELPGELYQFSVKRSREAGAWKRLRTATAAHPVVAGLFRGNVLALGRLSDLEAAFGEELVSRIEQVSLLDTNLSIANGVIRQIMLTALVDALAVRPGIARVGRSSLRTLDRMHHRYNGDHEYSRAVDLSLDYFGGQAYLVTAPDVFIHPRQSSEPLSKDEFKSLKRDILWRQRNRDYMGEVMRWRTLLFEPDRWRVVYPPGAETGFQFFVSKDGPACARRYSRRPGPVNANLASSFARFERFKSFAVKEPELNFAPRSRDRKPVRSSHPMRGLIECGGPFESDQDGLHTGGNIRLGIVCLQGHEKVLSEFLALLRLPSEVGRSDDAEYVVGFPGFEAAFKCGLSVPSPSDKGLWQTVRPVRATEPVAGYWEVVRAVTDGIRRIESAGGVDVVVVYIPDEWKPLERVEGEKVRLDLHDQLKAFCVGRQIRSQLLREAKIRSHRTARMRWWLSLALFAKSLRVPWILDSSAERVVYAGLGFAVDESHPASRIVLGCCHVFTASGTAMRFRLSELRNPVWKTEPVTRKKNPFMSEEDAYQLGVRTRQLFFESDQQVPDRVVVCKRTPFLEEETKGLLSALAGLGHVDLVSVEMEDAWRFCAHDPKQRQPHPFPVKRGTGIVLDQRSMLLWLHGNVIGLTKAGKCYFQGKSRIPGPVRITRFSGDSPVELLAQDMMALTKMDWNTFALYQKLPVTVTTPSVIARIGRLLPELPADSYDYRLFM